MRIPQTYIQHSKAGVHFAQAFCIFITGCLALAVLTKDGGTGGATGYMFGLVCLPDINVEFVSFPAHDML